MSVQLLSSLDLGGSAVDQSQLSENAVEKSDSDSAKAFERIFDQTSERFEKRIDAQEAPRRRLPAADATFEERRVHNNKTLDGLIGGGSIVTSARKRIVRRWRRPKNTRRIGSIARKAAEWRRSARSRMCSTSTRARS